MYPSLFALRFFKKTEWNSKSNQVNGPTTKWILLGMLNRQDICKIDVSMFWISMRIIIIFCSILLREMHVNDSFLPGDNPET